MERSPSSSCANALDLQQQSHRNPATAEPAPNRHSRTQSCSSLDRPLSSKPSSVSLAAGSTCAVPDPAYIAASAAARLVTSDHAAFFRILQEDGILGSGTVTMGVTDGSLRLVNQFLDFLLYQFLVTAKSATLAALRPAVQEVLRIKLAREALAGADQELESYLGDQDEAEAMAGTEQPGEVFDLEGSWRKVRVQCMVYSSLGDMEDDEVYGMEEDDGLVAPAVAIWLTSILEFIGEQILLVAGNAAIARCSTSRTAPASSVPGEENACPAQMAPFQEMPIVEELDTEKVALNTSLGRMWRQWRKQTRSGVNGPAFLSHQKLDRNTNLARRISDVHGRRDGGSPVASLRPSIASEDSAAPSLVESPTREEQSPASPAADEKSAAAVEESDAALSPREDTTSPGLLEDNADAESDIDYLNVPPTPKQRPQSLIIVPWTHTAPFNFFPSLKRPQSLPDLQRGDFADPIFDGKETVEDAPKSPGMELPRDVNIAEDGIPDDNSEQEFVTPAEERISLVQEARGSAGSKAREAKRRSLLVKVEAPDGREVPLAEKSRDKEAIISEAVKPALPSPASISSSRSNLSTESLRRESTKESKPKAPSIREIQSKREVISRTRSRSDSSDMDDRLPIQHPEPQITAKRPETSETDEVTFYPPAQATRVISIVAPRLEDIPSSARKASSSGCSSHSQASDRKPGKATLVTATSNQSLHSSHSDRGGRAFTPPHTPDRQPKARRSLSFSKMHRPTHTSGSVSSQASNKLKKIVPWANDGKFTESDTESRSSLHSERLMNMDEKQRSFEELISGEHTIHYTITPDPLRNTDDLPIQGHKKSVDGGEVYRTSSENHSIRSLGVTRTHPPPRPQSRDTNRTRSPVPPRINIPHRPADLPSVATPNSNPKSARFLGSTPSSTVSSRMPEIPSVIRQTGVNGDDISPLTPASGFSSASRKTRLQARDAAGTASSDTTSALADFFRSTNPPTMANSAGPRIPRNVAPFRDTMDSDQFDSEGYSNQSESFASTTVSASTALLRKASMRTPASSVTSINGKRAAPSSHAYSAVPSSSNHKSRPSTASTTSTIPKRQRPRRGPRDPYAISDDEDELVLDSDDPDAELLGLILPPPRKEESLIDFLKNAPPPPPLPAQDAAQQHVKLEKKSSSVSLMSRFAGRKKSMETQQHQPPQQQRQTPQHTPLVPQTSTMPKYHPIQINMPPGYSATSDSHYYNSSPQPTPSSASASASATPATAMQPQRRKPNFQVRDARTGGNGRMDTTDSLAKFLMSTAPPPSISSQPSSLALREMEDEEDRKAKWGWGKKKATGV